MRLRHASVATCVSSLSSSALTSFAPIDHADQLHAEGDRRPGWEALEAVRTAPPARVTRAISDYLNC